MKELPAIIKDNLFLEDEWLLTNGIGGYAYSPVSSRHTKAFHSLLVASLNPPVERINILNNLDEEVVIDGHSYRLESYQYETHLENNTKYTQKVLVGDVITYVYRILDVHIYKTITLVHDSNSVAINYHVLNKNHNLKLLLTPLMSLRDHGAIESYSQNVMVSSYSHTVSLVPLSKKDILIKMTVDEGVFTKKEEYRTGIDYLVDHETGSMGTDTLYVPGYFTTILSSDEDKNISFICTLDECNQSAKELIKEEILRKRALITSKDPLIQTLEKTCDQFIVDRKSTHTKTVIAGYPWFTDWGRDTLIALEGLTLVTKRYEDARSIIRTFATTLDEGVCVNMFPDDNNEPLYNTVDASLWLIHASYMYMKYTEDSDFIIHEIYPHLKEIISWYVKGTKHSIYMDDDFLLHAGSDEDQITWMDVRTHGKAVTPRHGKPVEINALWYNALRIMERFAEISDKDCSYGLLASKCYDSFNRKFYDEKRGYLLDVVEEDDDSLRPNQLYALSLPFNVFPASKAQRMMDIITNKLYVGYGIRSLEPHHPSYNGFYKGDLDIRDQRYHQGTSWGFLIGAYIRAYIKVYHDKTKALELLQPLLNALDHNLVNGINEIYDGDEPHTPRGAVNQAWSVAELLCAYNILK